MEAARFPHVLRPFCPKLHFDITDVPGSNRLLICHHCLASYNTMMKILHGTYPLIIHLLGHGTGRQAWSPAVAITMTGTTLGSTSSWQAATQVRGFCSSSHQSLSMATLKSQVHSVGEGHSSCCCSWRSGRSCGQQNVGAECIDVLWVLAGKEAMHL